MEHLQETCKYKQIHRNQIGSNCLFNNRSNQIKSNQRDNKKNDSESVSSKSLNVLTSGRASDRIAEIRHTKEEINTQTTEEGERCV